MESQAICKKSVTILLSISIFSSCAHRSHPLMVLNVKSRRCRALSGLNSFFLIPDSYRSSNLRKSFIATSWISLVSIGDAANW